MIGFLHPWALAGLVAAAIPVLLHLLARREPPTVVFPAVRYLITTTQEHQRRLKLQNLLPPRCPHAAHRRAGPGGGRSDRAAPRRAGPCAQRAGAGGRQLAEQRRRGRRDEPARPAPGCGRATVLARATPDDALWLLTADGVPATRRPRALRSTRSAALPVARAGSISGRALALAGEVLADESRPGEIVLLRIFRRARCHRPTSPRRSLSADRRSHHRRTSASRGLETGPQPWTTDGGRITVSLVGDSGRRSPVTAQARRPSARARPSRSAAAPSAFRRARRHRGLVDASTAELDPDELRLDDRRLGVVRVAPVARVNWDSASRYVAAACEVLETNRRIARGREVTIGRLARGSSIVQPPEDPAALGALNRALARAGCAWRYGAPGDRRRQPPTAGHRRPGARAAALSAPLERRAAGPVSWRPWAARRGWCGAGTSCCSAADSTRPGPTCRSPPGSCPSWMRWSTGSRGARWRSPTAPGRSRCSCPIW